MFFTGCRKFRTDQGRSHTFDQLSGWCIYGCGNRDDGKVIARDGRTLDAGPTYTNAEIAQMKQRSDNINEARTPARAAR